MTPRDWVLVAGGLRAASGGKAAPGADAPSATEVAALVARYG